MSHEGIRFTTEEEKARLAEENRPLPRTATTPAKVRVLLSENRGLEIDWQDGHKSAWSFPWLRAACPCATCVGERKADKRAPGVPSPKPAQLLPMYEPPAKPASAKAVGRYAIQFDWEDGHKSGLYSWEYLRRVCQCPECSFAADKPAGQPN
jgi:DUF971 family protein